MFKHRYMYILYIHNTIYMYIYTHIIGYSDNYTVQYMMLPNYLEFNSIQGPLDTQVHVVRIRPPNLRSAHDQSSPNQVPLPVP